MSKFDKPSRRIVAALVVTSALLAPMVAVSGLVEDTGATADKGDKPARGYVLRCWQEGRLIVEENLIALPPTVDLTAAKLKALDTDNQAVYVTETKNATCLIRARFAARTRGLTW